MVHAYAHLPLNIVHACARLTLVCAHASNHGFGAYMGIFMLVPLVWELRGTWT